MPMDNMMPLQLVVGGAATTVLVFAFALSTFFTSTFTSPFAIALIMLNGVFAIGSLAFVVFNVKENRKGLNIRAQLIFGITLISIASVDLAATRAIPMSSIAPPIFGSLLFWVAFAQISYSVYSLRNKNRSYFLLPEAEDEREGRDEEWLEDRGVRIEVIGASPSRTRPRIPVEIHVSVETVTL
jgi:hypothetical protein